MTIVRFDSCIGGRYGGAAVNRGVRCLAPRLKSTYERLAALGPVTLCAVSSYVHVDTQLGGSKRIRSCSRSDDKDKDAGPPAAWVS